MLKIHLVPIFTLLIVFFNLFLQIICNMILFLIQFAKSIQQCVAVIYAVVIANAYSAQTIFNCA